MRAWYDAEAGRLDPFILVLEGSVPNEEINGDGHWAALGVDRGHRAADHDQRVDRPARAAGRDRARAGHLRDLRRHPGDEEQPDRRDGPARPPRRELASRLGLADREPARLSRPSPTTSPRRCSTWCCRSPGRPGRSSSTSRGGPRWLFERTAHEVCNRAGFADHADYADELGDDGRCLVKFGCKGPVVRCNVPARGWINGDRRLPQRGRHLHRMHDARVPRQVPAADGHRPRRCKAIAAASRFTYGPLLKQLRLQSMKRRYEVEPEWRRPGDELVTGYAAALVIAVTPSRVIRITCGLPLCGRPAWFGARCPPAPDGEGATMCLAIPGQIVEVVDETQPARQGRRRRCAAHDQHRPARRGRRRRAARATGC